MRAQRASSIALLAASTFVMPRSCTARSAACTIGTPKATVNCLAYVSNSGLAIRRSG